MNTLEYADIINADIMIIRHHNQDNRYTAKFNNCEIKEGNSLVSSYGNGKSTNEAINNYTNKIIGKKIVFDAMSKYVMREYLVPKLEEIK